MPLRARPAKSANGFDLLEPEGRAVPQWSAEHDSGPADERDLDLALRRGESVRWNSDVKVHTAQDPHLSLLTQSSAEKHQEPLRQEPSRPPVC